MKGLELAIRKQLIYENQQFFFTLFLVSFYFGNAFFQA